MTSSYSEYVYSSIIDKLTYVERGAFRQSLAAAADDMSHIAAPMGPSSAPVKMYGIHARAVPNTTARRQWSEEAPPGHLHLCSRFVFLSWGGAILDH